MLPRFRSCTFTFFFFNDTATTEIYTLSLHDALPILPAPHGVGSDRCRGGAGRLRRRGRRPVLHHDGVVGRDRKSTRLNSSHSSISYAVYCLKKKNKKNINTTELNKYIIRNGATLCCL